MQGNSWYKFCTKWGFLDLGTFYRFSLVIWVIWLWTSMAFVFMLVIQGWTYCYNAFWLEWWMTNHPKIMLLFLKKKKKSCCWCLITHNPQAYLTTRTTAATTRESISYQRSYRFGPWNNIFRYRLIPICLFGFTAIYIYIYMARCRYSTYVLFFRLPS